MNPKHVRLGLWLVTAWAVVLACTDTLVKLGPSDLPIALCPNPYQTALELERGITDGLLCQRRTAVSLSSKD